MHVQAPTLYAKHVHNEFRVSTIDKRCGPILNEGFILVESYVVIGDSNYFAMC